MTKPTTNVVISLSMSKSMATVDRVVRDVVCCARPRALQKRLIRSVSFAKQTRNRPTNHVLDGARDPPTAKDNGQHLLDTGRRMQILAHNQGFSPRWRCLSLPIYDTMTWDLSSSRVDDTLGNTLTPAASGMCQFIRVIPGHYKWERQWHNKFIF